MTSRLPTTDLYFLHACGDWINRWWSRGPVKALGKNCFAVGETMILIRRDDEELMCRALDWPGRLIYLIDDDIAGATESSDLPQDYRGRLEKFNSRFHRKLLERADELLVSSPRLEVLFGGDSGITARIRRVMPYWPMPFADADHFEDLQHGRLLKIVHLGSGSHAGTFTALAPAVMDVIARHENVHFSYFGREAPPAFPADHPRIVRIAPMRWPAYRRWLARQRFHLALYPLDQGRFDSARSPNKIIEHAVIGAVGLYPENWVTASLTGGGSIAAPVDPADWAGVMRRAVEQGSELANLARQARRSLALANDQTAQRVLWAELLGLRVE
ncbi:glycosyltransferase family protein [Novosphingobium lindaniclasticum]|uniref:hypothetical protein n=1 Tax=Novosphingobium lindaniclasticum TaxID=1329895 RepID=UPI00126960F2|nr:hypothetical protein [Novosphingobium lindaniclasticum]